MIIRLIKKIINAAIYLINFILPFQIPKIIGEDIFYHFNGNAEPLVVPTEEIKKNF